MTSEDPLPRDERPYVVSSISTSGGGRGGIATLAAAGIVGLLLGLALGSGGEDGATPGVRVPPEIVTADQPNEHSERGAARAVTSLMHDYSLEVLVDRNVAETTFDEMGTPAFVRSELRAWDRAASTPGGRLLARAENTRMALAQTVPLRYAIDSYGGDRAVLRLWTMTLLAARGLAPSAQFSVDRATLLWQGDRWRIDRLAQVREGPTPGALLSELTHSSRAVVEELRGFREVSNAR